MWSTLTPGKCMKQLSLYIFGKLTLICILQILTAEGYVVPQFSAGVPVAISMQPGSVGAAPQDTHQPVVLVPVSGASPGQHVMVQAASPEGMSTSTLQEQFQSRLVNISPSNAMSTGTDSSPNETEIPRSFRHGGYSLLKNEEVGVTY